MAVILGDVVPYRHSYTSIEHTKLFALSQSSFAGSHVSLTWSHVVVEVVIDVVVVLAVVVVPVLVVAVTVVSVAVVVEEVQPPAYEPLDPSPHDPHTLFDVDVAACFTY